MRTIQITRLVSIVAVLAISGCSDDPVSPAPAGQLRVPVDYPTIQDAINAACIGDTVVVAAEVYTALHEHTLFYGRVIQVAGVLKQGVVLRGATGDPADVVIDPQGAGWGLWCVEVDEATGLSSLTVRNALWAVSGFGASPWIDNCVFENNGDVEAEPSSSGTGMYFDRSSSLVTDCVFRNNQASSGGGATFSSSSDVRFERCSFLDNQATKGGGLTVGNNTTATLVDCMVNNNTATEWGGGIYVHGNGLTVVGGAVSDNAAGEGGGGLCFSFVGMAELEDVGVTGNVAPEGPQGHVEGAYLVELNCCDTDPEEWSGYVTVNDEGCDE